MSHLSIVFTLTFLVVFVGSQNDDLSPSLTELIESQEAVVKEMAAHVTRLFEQRRDLVRECECSRHACSNNFTDAPCVYHLGVPDICNDGSRENGRRVDYETSIFRVPPDSNENNLSASLKESICVYNHLETLTRPLGISEVGWMFLGTRDGHFRRWPATARRRGEEFKDQPFGGCKPYDPRIRPWYIAASTGPKDIVIVVDKSESMADRVAGDSLKSKWTLTKEAVGRMLETFTFADFVNVVTFSDSASALWTDSNLARGTADNLEKIRLAMQDQFATGNTNFTAAFNTAFNLLGDCTIEPKTCSDCQKIILFLTDGFDTSGEGETSVLPSVMAARIDDMQEELKARTGKRAAIFTYSMTKQADDRIPRQIACANNGAWAFIGLGTDPLDALNSYYLYIAAGSRTDAPIWIEPYEDASDLGVVTSVAMPFYAKGTAMVPDVFLGVVAHAVLFTEFERTGVNAKETLNALIDRSEHCSLSIDTDCELQVYRNSTDERAVCPDRFPAFRGINSVPLCYKHRQSFYKRMADKVTWGIASSLCEDDGGQLVSIENADELAFLASLSAIDGSWIGARRPSTSHSNFSWLSNAENLTTGSPFWGVGEPTALRGNEECVSIDPRGTTANLRATQCTNRLTYICEYSSAEACGERVRTVNKNDSFTVPQLESCASIELLDMTRPAPEAANLLESDIICEFGEPELSSADAICCDSGYSIIENRFYTLSLSLFFIIMIAAFTIL